MAAVATAAAPQVAVDPRLRRWRAVVWVAAGVFVVVFGLLILQRHRTFGTFNFDLGIFDQGLWLLSRAETPFITLRGLHLFGDHSSYLMLPVVPLYWVLPDVRAMLILTVVVLALGAPVVWAAARGRGFVSPGLGGSRRRVSLPSRHSVEHLGQLPPRDPDHPAADRGLRPRSTQPLVAMVALLVLVLAAKEDAALVVVPFALYVWWRWRRPGWPLRSLRWVSALSCSTRWCCSPCSRPPEIDLHGALRPVRRGARRGARRNGHQPGKGGRRAGHQRPARVPGGDAAPLATCLFAPELLAVGLPITLANLLSIHVYQHELKWHYTSYLIAVVAMAAVVGARASSPASPTSPSARSR